MARLLAETGRAGPAPHRGPQDAFPLIDLDTLPRRSMVLVQRFRRAGLLVYLRDITGDTGVATVSCHIVEPRPGGRPVVHGGAGSHPDARAVVNRALTEAAQSRVGHIQGGREDLPDIVRPSTAFDPETVYGSGPVRSYAALPTREHADIDHDVRFLLERVAALGFAQVVAIDLTRPEVGVPAVTDTTPWPDVTGPT